MSAEYFMMKNNCQNVEVLNCPVECIIYRIPVVNVQFSFVWNKYSCKNIPYLVIAVVSCFNYMSFW